MIKTPCLNHEVKKAIVFCLYSALRCFDVEPLDWKNIKTNCISISQERTDVNVEIPLHPISIWIAGERKEGKVFKLPTHDGANKVLKNWCKDAGVTKHITWHCARLSFSVLLQDEGVNTATVAGMLGHTSTKYVERVYQRYRLDIGEKAIQKLPSPEF